MSEKKCHYFCTGVYTREVSIKYFCEDEMYMDHSNGFLSKAKKTSHGMDKKSQPTETFGVIP